MPDPLEPLRKMIEKWTKRTPEYSDFDVCAEDLAAALPALEEAMAAERDVARGEALARERAVAEARREARRDEQDIIITICKEPSNKLYSDYFRGARWVASKIAGRIAAALPASGQKEREAEVAAEARLNEAQRWYDSMERPQWGWCLARLEELEANRPAARPASGQKEGCLLNVDVLNDLKHTIEKAKNAKSLAALPASGQVTYKCAKCCDTKVFAGLPCQLCVPGQAEAPTEMRSVPPITKSMMHGKAEAKE